MALDSIENYYEYLVAQQISDTLSEYADDQDFLDDVACVALNQLPARYVRHRVDLMFYMSGDERAEISKAVDESVRTAVEFVEIHRRRRPQTIHQ